MIGKTIFNIKLAMQGLPLLHCYFCYNVPSYMIINYTHLYHLNII